MLGDVDTARTTRKTVIEFTPTALTVTTLVSFTPGPVKDEVLAEWRRGVEIWNGRFAVTNGEFTVPIVFDIRLQPRADEFDAFKEVDEAAFPTFTDAGPGERSHSDFWSTTDPAPERMAAHEGGHLVGMEDLYDLPQSEFVERTGRQPDPERDAYYPASDTWSTRSLMGEGNAPGMEDVHGLVQRLNEYVEQELPQLGRFRVVPQ